MSEKTTTNTSQFRISKNSASGNGTTSKIREQLNFKDDRKWKQFSSRRLELIDKFGLSNKKASEQDDNIRQIATILRTEFNYPVSYSPEFEKLVTAAVQSVRRNRKRSKKNFITPNNSKNTSTAEVSSTPPSDDDNNNGNVSRVLSPVPSQFATPMTFTINASMQNSNKQYQLPSMQPKLGHVLTTDKNNKGKSASMPKLNLPSSYSSPSVRTEPTNPLSNSYNDIIKSVISEIVNNIIPLSEQFKKEGSDIPNLSDFALSTQDHKLLSISNDNTGNKGTRGNDDVLSLPGFLRKNILIHIQRSRTCSEMALPEGSIDNYENLEILGEMSIKSAIVFVIERFFSNLLPNSMQYISSKTMSKETLASLSVKLFDSATNHNLAVLPIDNVQIKLFYLLLGGIIKDFGFDPILYPLSEIIHHIVVKQYPVESSNQTGAGISTSTNHNQQVSISSSIRTAVLCTTSMKPQQANEDVNRKVLIKFKDRQQLFKFPLLSNGTPTVNEILESSRSLFNIVKKSDVLGLYHNNNLVVEDNELVKLFNGFPTSNEIILEIKEKEFNENLPKIYSVPSIKHHVTNLTTTSGDQNESLGLRILSAVSLGIKDESNVDNQKVTHTLPITNPLLSKNMRHSDSVSKLDNIISRISSEPALAPVSSKPNLKGSFENGNLPQPMFQPLL
ncbi:hypothetical protein TPHA_0J00900 [Tetrapisispora phaffii CBS 4417]|uniref:Transcription factor VHR1 n=1 Tax=Tetrapisispora phaffii (strain ATCC 24235 / CBS 4417 / NBRC 1672 / NRRL Y-8282 / UCD 70-5) TaxID=1071381 RepID=G8BYH0_TETPH|nr:hypothetical protein TPHA_0J00900 [Tetrapisispora phaffii CBS 4417]CCE64912.1 hypothetical protein TPHA_0J00900 [Tetrapisispora phaffii CBS 4417]